MKVLIQVSLVVLFLSSSLFAQDKGLDYYLPQDIKYDSNIPNPESVLGYPCGKWHVSHDQLVYYMRILAEASNRVELETYAHTYEDRPLLLLKISSPENLENLKEIKANHLALSEGKGNTKGPVVIYQGYSVHGNESSGANAALLYAYYLAAGQGKEIEQQLKNAVVLLDPVMNPDGLNRFASWVNTHKSKHLDPSVYSREHNEAWPGGRTNHYWFDLNRDWLLVQHPESQGRIRNFHKWKPNVLTDHHEMGSNSTFFFQPGIPSRTNPLTPEKNQELTGELAEYHASALDAIGTLYYSKESFDDFYIGKGSTYPDVNSCVGILFEQASSRGHLKNTNHGLLSFPYTIKNQFETSVSTLEGSVAMREKLLGFQKDYAQKTKEKAKNDGLKAYVFSAPNDAARLYHFSDLLSYHKVEQYLLAKDLNIGNQKFSRKESLVVPLNQQQYTLVKGLFEERTTFQDSLFYDVSTWTMQHAFNLNFAPLKTKDFNANVLGEKIEKLEFPEGRFASAKIPYAYVFSNSALYSPKAMYELLDMGLIIKVANKPFKAPYGNELLSFKRGTIMVPVKTNEKILSASKLNELMERLAKENSLEVSALETGFTPEGIDLGSPSFSLLEVPRIALIVDEGVSAYDAGEIWHLLDQRFAIDVSLIPTRNIAWTNLDDFNTIIMANGSQSGIKDPKKVVEWVKEGGTLICIRGAIRWAVNNQLAGVRFRGDNTRGRLQTKAARPYDKQSPDSGAQVIGGAIFETQLDLTHPLCYGYEKETLPVFRKGTIMMEPGENPYSTPLRYSKASLLSGYISDKNLQRLNGSAAAIVSGTGRGNVICLSDNPNFRAFWYGTNKLFTNALFFGPSISRSSREVVRPKPEAPKKENE